VEDLLKLNDRTASWVARDALRELRSGKIRARLEKKAQARASKTSST